MKRSSAVLAMLIATGASPLAAQNRRQAPLALRLPAAAHAAALGNAFPLASTDAEVLFYHPAQIAAARGLGGTLSAWGEASMLSVAAAGEWWNGGIAIGLQALSYGATGLDAGAFARGEAGLGQGGPIAASEIIGSAGYGRALFGFRAGVVGKIAEQRVAGERDVTAAADVGLGRRLGPVTLAVSAQNLGRQPQLESLDTRLPRTLELAAATPEAPVGPFDVSLAASLSYLEGGTLVPGGGAEIGYWPVPGRTFIARIGARYVEDSDIRPLTLGAGFIGDRISIDYAFADFDGGDPVHRVGLRLR